MGTAVQFVKFDAGETTHLGMAIIQPTGSQAHARPTATPDTPIQQSGAPQKLGIRGRILTWIVPQ